jgi:hypothetical protein
MKTIKILAVLLTLLIPGLASAVTRIATTRAAFDAAMNASGCGDIIRIPGGAYSNWGNIVIPASKDMTPACRVFIEGERDASGNNITIFQGQNAFEIEFRVANWTLRNVAWRGQTACTPHRAVSADNSLVTFNGSQNTGIDGVLVTDHGGSRTTGAIGNCIRVVKTVSGRNTTDFFITNSIFRNIWQQHPAAFLFIAGEGDLGFPVGGIIDNNVFDTRQCNATVQLHCYWIRFGNGQSAAAYPSGIKFRYNVMRFTTPTINGQDEMHLKSSGWEMVGNVFQGVGTITVRQGNNYIIDRNTWANPNHTRQPRSVILFGENHVVTNNLCYSSGGGKTCFRFGMGNPEPTTGTRGPDHAAFANSVVAHNTCDGMSVSCMELNGEAGGGPQGTATIEPFNIRFHNNYVRQSTGIMVEANNCSGRFSAISHNARTGTAAPGCMTTGTNNIAPSKGQRRVE